MKHFDLRPTGIAMLITMSYLVAVQRGIRDFPW